MTFVAGAAVFLCAAQSPPGRGAVDVVAKYKDIARRIIERHQGRLTVESSPGAGTTFTFDLAAATGD